MMSSPKNPLILRSSCVLLLVLMMTGLSWAQDSSFSSTDGPAPLLPPETLDLFFEHPDVAPPEPKEGEELQLPGPEEMADQKVGIQLVMRLFSEVELKAVRVKIGTSPGASDFLNKRYLLDQTAAEVGFEHIQNGKSLQLNCGQHYGIAKLYAEVILEDRFGQQSEPKIYNPD